MQQPMVRVKCHRVGDSTSVWQAAQIGDVAGLQMCIAAGSDPLSLHPVHRITPLCLAVDNSQHKAVEFLLQAGANPFEINDRHKGGTNSSLFILSCMRGDVNIATALYTAISLKGQAGKEHALHLNNEGLDALGASMAHALFKSLLKAFFAFALTMTFRIRHRCLLRQNRAREIANCGQMPQRFH